MGSDIAITLDWSTNIQEDMIPLINELQYRSMFLNEERHYPKFLDKLKEDVSVAIGKHVLEMMKKKIHCDIFEFTPESAYVNKITIDLTMLENGDISDQRAYEAYYFNNDPKGFDVRCKNRRH